MGAAICCEERNNKQNAYCIQVKIFVNFMSKDKNMKIKTQILTQYQNR